MASEDADHLHNSSYFWGLEIGLQTALCCKSREDIQECLNKVQVAAKRRPKSPAGEAEWRSWMIELEMQSWEKNQ